MYKVIIADDEYWTIEKMKKLFVWEDYGFELCAQTQSSKELIQLVEQINPDVIFVDINMPGMTGIEALKRIREGGSKCKAVIISAYSEFKDAQMAIKYGAFEYCLKPITQDSADQLLQVLRTTLDEERGVLEQEQIGEIENKAFEKMVTYIKNNYREKLYLGELSKMFHLNLTYCCYLFNKNFGCSFTAFLIHVRMEKAAEFLLSTGMTTQQIAEYLGYDYYYFNKIFKKYFQMTPKQYKQEKKQKR